MHAVIHIRINESVVNKFLRFDINYYVSDKLFQKKIETLKNIVMCSFQCMCWSTSKSRNLALFTLFTTSLKINFTISQTELNVQHKYKLHNFISQVSVFYDTCILIILSPCDVSSLHFQCLRRTNPAFSYGPFHHLAQSRDESPEGAGICRQKLVHFLDFP